MNAASTTLAFRLDPLCNEMTIMIVRRKRQPVVWRRFLGFRARGSIVGSRRGSFVGHLGVGFGLGAVEETHGDSHEALEVLWDSGYGSIVKVECGWV